MAELVSTFSKDPSTKVGAVIVDTDNRLVSVGFNGFPAKLEDKAEDYLNRDVKYVKIIHAELNSILFAKRDIANTTIYTYPFLSCTACTKIIIQAGITKIVTLKQDEASERYMRWKDEFELSKSMYTEAGVEVIELNCNDA